jgi:hypothetical protein
MNYTFVIYKGEKYSLLHKYESGYCEIKKEGASLNNVELVHISELTEVIKESRTR